MNNSVAYYYMMPTAAGHTFATQNNERASRPNQVMFCKAMDIFSMASHQLKPIMMNTTNMNVLELDAQSLLDFEGGGILEKFGWGYVATQVVEHWDEIKKGLADGWNAAN